MMTTEPGFNSGTSTRSTYISKARRLIGPSRTKGPEVTNQPPGTHKRTKVEQSAPSLPLGQGPGRSDPWRRVVTRDVGKQMISDSVAQDLAEPPASLSKHVRQTLSEWRSVRILRD
jgi:hypothetical protein